MKRLLVTGIVFIVLTLLGVLILTKVLQKNSKQSEPHKNSQEKSSSETVNTSLLPTKKSLFVPYWQLTDNNQLSDVNYLFDLTQGKKKYDRHLYFGITGNGNGIDKTDTGYQNLASFTASSPGPKWLVVRMTDGDINDEVLRNKDSQSLIAQEAVGIAKQYGFAGVILDFEYASLFGGQIEDVSALYGRFREETRKEKLAFGATIYGDVFYRRRPYDVAKIAEYSDEVFIMAYDFHKSRGEPGPNFPLHSDKKYTYGYEELLSDLQKRMPLTKITFIFGLYGYDWKVDEQKRPITQARSLTTAQIQKEFVNNCDALHCAVLNDSESGETEINYIDGDTRYHIIWYENAESITKKVEFLKQNGISSFAYWAYGYF